LDIGEGEILSEAGTRVPVTPGRTGRDRFRLAKGWQMTKTQALYRKLLRAAGELKRACGGQDLIEYALMSGFIACFVVTFTPQVADSFVTIMSKANSVVIVAGS